MAHINITLAAPTEPSDVDVSVIERELLSNNAENQPVNEVEKAISTTIISSKVYKPLTYEQAIFDLIHSYRWKKVIEEEIQNLENHHI